MFSRKDNGYELRDPLPLVQQKHDTTNFGLRTFSYLGSKLWNDFPSSLKINIEDADILEFKSRLKLWSFPNYEDMPSFYV